MNPEQAEDRSKLSDGYHTFEELYEHRHALLLALMRTMPECFCASWKHSDGEPCFGGDDWFIICGQLPNGAQISYHLPARLWDAAVATGCRLPDCSPLWDGHSSADVVNRLLHFAIRP